MYHPLHHHLSKSGDQWLYLKRKKKENKKPDNLFLQVGAKFKLRKTQTGQ